MENDTERHDRRVKSVVDAVVKLATLPQMTPEAVFEGAVKGAIVLMLSQELSTAEVGQLLRVMAEAVENPEPPKFSVVKP